MILRKIRAWENKSSRVIDNSKNQGRQESLVPKKITENITLIDFKTWWKDMGIYINRCFMSKTNSPHFWAQEISQLLPAGWKEDMKEEMQRAAKVEDLKVLKERKILIKNSKWKSKLGFFTAKIDPDTSIDSAVNKVSNMYDSSTLQEIFPEKCNKCGNQTVDRDRVEAPPHH